MPKKIITLITDRFYTSNHASVIRINSLANALFKNHDYQIKILTSKKGHLHKKYNSYLSFLNPPNNKSSFIRRLFKEILFSLELSIRLIFIKTDYVFISSPPFIMSLYCSFISIIKRKPYILDVRDLYPEVFFSAGLFKSTNIIGIILSSLEDKMYRNSIFIISTTHSWVKQISRFQKDTFLVRNGFIESLIPKSVNKYSTFTVVFHGNLGIFQNIELLIEIANKFDQTDTEIKFLVIGSGSKQYLLKNTNIEFIGHRALKDIYSIISRCHLGVSFRTKDPLSIGAIPVKIYEYISMRIPVVVVPKGEAGDLIESLGMGYQFDPHQFEEIFLKINKLTNDFKCEDKYSSYDNKPIEDFNRSLIATDFVKILNDNI